jgi:ATP-binding cassette subfamily F protein uup
MTIFSCNGIAKAFNDKELFDDVAFGMEQGERVGIIGRNGAGKTTLMKIIAGLETADEGDVVFNNEARLEFLEQMPEFSEHDTALDAVMKSRPQLFELFEDYRLYNSSAISASISDSSARLTKITQKLDEAGAWNFENECRKALTMLGIAEYDKDVTTMSGGQRKRVALARVLMSKPDLLIMDEPTNHLDADSVQWLQDYMQSTSQSILFVTHDRYFLDAVATRIIEIYDHKVYSYPGNYEKYLEQKAVLVNTHEATVNHKLSKLRTELAWLQRGAKARRTKQQSRIDWIEEMKKSAVHKFEKDIKIELGKTFLGKRIIEAHHIRKSIGGKLLFDDVTYLGKPRDRIGIIGPNGSGKSTLLKVLSGEIANDEGNMVIGNSVNIGFFRQESEDLKGNITVVQAVREIADNIDVGFGRNRYISASEMLDKFLFPRYQHNNFVSTLSGGEKRRLSLVRVLMKNPNVLFLDEPTNDFDIQTLSALEEYLDDFFGVLIIVSHDRAFLDRTVEFIWAFDGRGKVKEYPGNYSAYLEKREKEIQIEKESRKTEKKESRKDNKPKVKRKLSYKEQLEFDKLEEEIPGLEEKKKQLEEKAYNSGITDYEKLKELSDELGALEDILDEKTMRWIELSESVGN